MRICLFKSRDGECSKVSQQETKWAGSWSIYYQVEQ